MPAEGRPWPSDDDDDAGLALHDGLHHLGTLVQAGEHGHLLKTRSFHWKPRQPPNVYSPAFNLVFKNILFFWMDLLCLSAYQHNWDEIDGNFGKKTLFKGGPGYEFKLCTKQSVNLR